MKRFLCCFTTREGSYICGVGALVIGALRIYLQWFNIEFLHRLTPTQKSDLPLPLKTIKILSKVETSITAVTIFVVILLLIGLFKHKQSLIVPWIVWVLVEEMKDVCIIIFYVVKQVKLSCSVYIGDSIMFVINLYCVLCVYSYLKQLKEEARKNKRLVYSLGSYTDENDEECLLSSSSGIV